MGPVDLWKKSGMTPTSTNPTSNDLLFRLTPEYQPQSMNYTVIAQSAEEVQDIENAPSVNMGPYLISSE
jgi:hypothetical protein